MSRNTVQIAPLASLSGLKKLAPGVYTDDNGSAETLTIRVPEFMTANGLRDTPRKRRDTLETIVSALRETFPALPVRLVEIADEPEAAAPLPVISPDWVCDCGATFKAASLPGCNIPLAHDPDRYVAEVTA